MTCIGRRREVRLLAIEIRFTSESSQSRQSNRTNFPSLSQIGSGGSSYKTEKGCWTYFIVCNDVHCPSLDERNNFLKIYNMQMRIIYLILYCNSNGG